MPLRNPFKTGLPLLHSQERVESLLLGHGTGPRVLILPGLPGSQIGRPMDNLHVADAIVDLLQNDRTAVLHEQKPPLLPGSGTFTDSKLASLEGGAHELGALALGEVRNILSLWDTVPPEIN